MEKRAHQDQQGQGFQTHRTLDYPSKKQPRQPLHGEVSPRGCKRGRKVDAHGRCYNARTMKWFTRFPNYAQSREVPEARDEHEARALFAQQQARHIPCVIRGAARHWAAMERWTPDGLKSRVGDHVLGGKPYTGVMT